MNVQTSSTALSFRTASGCVAKNLRKSWDSRLSSSRILEYNRRLTLLVVRFRSCLSSFSSFNSFLLIFQAALGDPPVNLMRVPASGRLQLFPKTKNRYDDHANKNCHNHGLPPYFIQLPKSFLFFASFFWKQKKPGAA